MRSRWLGIVFCLGVIALVWGGLSWAEGRRHRLDLEEAQREMASGRFYRARQRLAELVNRRPKSSDAIYQLGLCEERLGRTDAALAAWSLVPTQSPFALKAALGRARLLMNTGRLRAAEAILLVLPRDRRLEGRQALEALELLFHLQGRTAEVRELVLQDWSQSDDPATLLRRLYLVDDAAFPADYVRTTLETGDPNDDRVWLGKAHLAAWSGRFDEASRWLAACAERRPRRPRGLAGSAGAGAGRRRSRHGEAGARSSPAQPVHKAGSAPASRLAGRPRR